jgi:DNA-binding Xre family transcriptional regulator
MRKNEKTRVKTYDGGYYGPIIKTIQEEKGKKNKFMAQKMGFSEPHYSNLTNGKVEKISLETLEKAAEALEVEVNNILFYEQMKGEIKHANGRN